MILGNGGCKEDKFTRDIRLLEEDLKENPKNERTYFYLANSYKNAGNLEKAIEHYIKRNCNRGMDRGKLVQSSRIGKMLYENRKGSRSY